MSDADTGTGAGLCSAILRPEPGRNTSGSSALVRCASFRGGDPTLRASGSSGCFTFMSIDARSGVRSKAGEADSSCSDEESESGI